MGWQVARSAVRDGDGRVRPFRLLHQEGREGFPDDVAPTHDDDVLAAGIVSGAKEKFHDARGRRRCETRSADQDEPHVRRVEAVHVLPRVHGRDGGVEANLRRKRLLDEDPMDLEVRIQPRYLVEQTTLGDLFGQLHGPVREAHFLGSLALHLHVELRARVLSDDDRGEARHDPSLREGDEARLQFRANLVRDLLPVDEFAGHSATRKSGRRAAGYSLGGDGGSDV